LPVVGTYTRNYSWPRAGFRLYFNTLSGVKIKPKASMQSAYSSEYGTTNGYYSTIGEWHGLDNAAGLAAVQSVSSASGAFAYAYNAAYNRAYGKINEQLSQQAQNLTALAEINSSFEMIFKRMTSMTKAYTALKKGNLRSALNYLSVQKPLAKHRRTRWTNPQDASALWLEYWFGWAPMLSDIWTSLEILYNLSPYSDRPLEGKGRGNFAQPFQEDKAPGSYNTKVFNGTCFVRLSTRVTVSNPNLFLAARLGLLNPVGTAFELIPFSWLGNWFSNIGTYIQSWSDHYGLTFTDTFETCYVRCNGTETWSRSYGVERDGFSYEIHKTRRSSRAFLRKPALVWELPDRLSLTRAATASSIITLLFSPNGGGANTRKI